MNHPFQATHNDIYQRITKETYQRFVDEHYTLLNVHMYKEFQRPIDDATFIGMRPITEDPLVKALMDATK
jgi:hypothetical protein